TGPRRTFQKVPAQRTCAGARTVPTAARDRVHSSLQSHLRMTSVEVSIRARDVGTTSLIGSKFGLHMTVIAIWYEQSDDAIWSVADTRISRPGCSGGHVVQTDSGAKLFSLPISCRELAANPFLRRMPYYNTTFGFAFAGDVLPAAMTIATATALC